MQNQELSGFSKDSLECAKQEIWHVDFNSEAENYQLYKRIIDNTPSQFPRFE